MANRFLSNIRINDAYTLPASDGTSGQVISTDGAGNLSFTDASTGGAPIMYRDDFAGDGSTVLFQLANPVSNIVQTQVYIDGTYQEKETYSVNGQDLTFLAAPPNGTSIEVISLTSINFAGDFVLDTLRFTGGTADQGTLSWNTEDETLDLIVSPNVTYQIGQELGHTVRNLSGVTLNNGAVVRVTGASGNKITVDLADNTAELGSSETFAVVTETISNNSTGKVTTEGLVRGLDTSAFAEGVAIWLGTNGAFTDTKPLTPNHLVHIGWVVRSHATEGAILVKVSNGWEMEELHDVLITNVADKDMLVWNSTLGYWENSKTLGDITTGNITTDGTVDGVDISAFKAAYDVHTHVEGDITDFGNYLTNITHDTVNNKLVVTTRDAATFDVDLSQYIDDTNLARLTSGSLDAGTGIATFTRDDATTFTVDFSALFDDTDTNDFLTGASFNTADGVLTLNVSNQTDVTVDLDGRYLESYTETDTLATVTGRGATTTSDLTTGTLNATKSAKNDYGIQIKGAFYGSPRLQLYDLSVDSNAHVGLGVDMSGGAYEMNAYFPRYNGYGRFSIGSWAGDFGTGQHVSGYNEKLYITESAAGVNVPLSVSGNVSITGTISASGYNNSNWDTAYGWGDHSTAGYQAASSAITTSNIGSQSVNYATSATRLYASDSPYTVDGTYPYYMYMNYDGGSYWELKVSPATPGEVRVAYSNNSNQLAGRNLDGSTGIGERLFNNQGRNHDTFIDFNSTAIRSGANYLQQGTNGPTGTASHQWYGFRLGLGADYGTVTGSSGHYASDLYWGRQSQGGNPYLWSRDMEGGNWSSWRKMSAGYADNSGLLNGWSRAQNGANVVLETASNGYLYINNWIHPSNGAGLFYDSGPHFYESGATMYSSHTLRSGDSLRAPIFYDENDTTYYVNPNDFSSLRGLAIRGDLSASDSGNQIFFWGSGDTTTSAIGFKSNAGEFVNPTGFGDGYNTYLTMDTDGRGWVFRRGTGGSDFTSAYTAGWILNNGVAQFNSSTRSPIFYDSNNTGYYVDPASTSQIRKTNIIALGSAWDAGLNLYSNNGSDRWNVLVDEGASNWLRFAYNNSEKIRVETNGTTTFMQGVYSNDAFLAPIFYDSNNTNYRVDPDGTSVLNGLTVGGADVILGSRKSYGSISGSSGDWYPLLNANDFNGPVFATVTTYAHSSFSIVCSGGYGPSNQPSLQVLSTTWNNNGGYANATGVRIRQDGWVEVKFEWSSGPSVSVRVQAYNSSGTPVTFAGSLAATTATNAVKSTFGLTTTGAMQANYTWSNVDQRAPIFYDSNDTSRYVNPDSQSNMGKILFLNTVDQGTPVGEALVGRNYAYNTLELKGYGAEMMIGSQSQDLHINYRYCNGVGNNTYTPQNWYWRAGTSSSLSNHHFGYVYGWQFYDESNTAYYLNPDGTSLLYSVAFNGTTSLNNNELRLVSLSDGNHYLKKISTGYSGVTIDGPQLQGHQGGELTTNNGGNNWALRWGVGGNVTINNSLSINKSSQYGEAVNLTYSGSNSSAMLIRNNTGATATAISFFYSSAPQGARGSITVSSTSTAYNTSSDYRLKENVVPMTGSLERVDQLNPSRFNFIGDDKTVDGFLAHEAAEVVPEAVTGVKDEVDEEGNPVYQGIDQAKLVPLLVGAIQELKAEVEALKQKLNGTN